MAGFCLYDSLNYGGAFDRVEVARAEGEVRWLGTRDDSKKSLTDGM